MSAPVRNPAYRVTTERLLIRCWEPADAHQRRAAIRASESELRPWIPFMRDEPRSLFDTIQMLRLQRANFDADQDYRYAVYSLDGDERVDGIAIVPVGVEIGPLQPQHLDRVEQRSRFVTHERDPRPQL